MDISSKANRAQLRDYFKKNAIPTESQFAELISSMINQADDSIAKIDGQPLSLKPDVGDSGNKKVLNLYKSFDQNKPNWTLSLTPLSNQADPESAKSGLSFGDGDGMSKLFVDETTGNVGIGTTSPKSKLDVEGGAVIGAAYSGTNAAPTNGLLVEGNVGIGTSSPLTKLHVVGHPAIRGGVSAAEYTEIGHGGAHGFINTVGNGNLEFRHDNNTKMIVASDGKVGIGTTDPKNKLDVEGGAVIGAAYSGTNAAPTNGLLVEGNVGIGTNNADAPLTVASKSTGSDAPIAKFIAGNQTGTRSMSILQPSSSTDQNSPFTFFTANGFKFKVDNYDALNIRYNGKVGIGTTSPSEELEVNGNIKATGTVTALNMVAKIEQSMVDNPHIVAGMILMWSGSETQIPHGWIICNGSNETPDLRGRFILGCGDGSGLSKRTIDQKGGSESVTLTTSQMPKHKHEINDPEHKHGHYNHGSSSRHAGDGGSGHEYRYSGQHRDTGSAKTGITIKDTGSGQSHENMPPFYVLAFIMKT